jgi:hypothetical protein
MIDGASAPPSIMLRYSLLNAVNIRRRFDPASEQDVLELKHYLDTNQWTGPCPFYLEDDWDNIPVMCMHKYARHMLSSKKTTKQKTKSPK